MPPNSSACRLAPPTSAPSTSGCCMMPAMLAALTEPPYRMRTASAASAPCTSATRPRTAAQTSWASSGVATSPVPIAQTGSEALTRPANRAAGDDVAALFADLETFADTHDRRHARRQRLVGLRVHQGVVLVVVLTALG